MSKGRGVSIANKIGNVPQNKTNKSKTLPKGQSLRIILTCSKRTLATVNQVGEIQQNMEPKRQKLTKQADNFAVSKNLKTNKDVVCTEVVPGTSSQGIQHSCNNNATVSTPVVGSAKSLIDSIKQTRRQKLSRKDHLADNEQSHELPVKHINEPNNLPGGSLAPAKQKPVKNRFLQFCKSSL